MEVKDLFQNLMALLEDYREWISEGINQDYVLYLKSKNEISDLNQPLLKAHEVNTYFSYEEKLEILTPIYFYLITIQA